MQKIICSTVVVVLLASSTIRAEALPVLRLSTGEWEPWTSELLPHQGIASRIVEQAFAAANVTVEIEFFPWVRAFELAENLDADASFAWIRSESREKHFLYSNAIFVGTTVFFHRATEPVHWNKLTDLSGKIVGTTIGYSYGKSFSNALAEKVFIEDTAPSDESNIKKLLHGRIDLFPVDQFVGLALVRKVLGKDAAKLEFNSRPISVSSNHLIVSKKHPKAQQIISAFNSGLKILNRINQLDYIESSYPTK